MLIWTGFLLGLLGSLHCVGMCGPIVIALSSSKTDPVTFFLGRLSYSLGRIITYSFLGVIAGLIGMGLSLAGAQRWVSLVLGILILVSLFLPKRLTNFMYQNRLYAKLMDLIKVIWKKLTGSHSLGALLVIGILNGFLPCGFVWIALAGAIATGGVLNSSLYMAAFGLGTVPILVATSYAGNLLTMKFRHSMSKLIPVGIAVLGILFVLRGLSLGIPYISPKVVASETEKGTQVEMECCH